MKNSACFSHSTDDWKTPSALYDHYINELKCVDCFPYHSNYDEFQMVYKNQRLFVNPPYSKLKLLPKWVKTQIVNGCIVYLLIPARTDTAYFHELLKFKPAIEFIKGRLHFNDSKNSAPFPSLVMIFSNCCL